MTASVPHTFEEWVMEYSCVHCMHTVVAEIKAKSSRWPYLSKKYGDHLILITLLRIVETRNIQEYEIAIDILDYLWKDVRVLSSGNHARISYGLKILVMLYKVWDKRPDAIPKLNRYFPKASESDGGVRAAQIKVFRRLVLQLLVHKEMRKKYFEKTFMEDYGEEFHQNLKELTDNVVKKCFKKLKTPVLDCILNAGNTSTIYQDMSSSSLPLVQYLVEMLFSSPGPDDFLELVNMIYPESDIPRVDPADFRQTLPESPQDVFSKSPERELLQSSQESYVTCETTVTNDDYIARKRRRYQPQKPRTSDPLFSDEEDKSVVTDSDSEDPVVQTVPNLGVHLTRSRVS